MQLRKITFLIILMPFWPSLHAQDFAVKLLSLSPDSAASEIQHHEHHLLELISDEANPIDSLLNRLNVLCDELGNHSVAAQKLLGQALLERAKVLNDTINMIEASANVAYALMNEGSYEEALQYFYQKLEYEENSNLETNGLIYNNIGNTFYMMNDHENAVRYLRKFLIFSVQKKDSSMISRAYLNISNPFYDLGEFDSSMMYLQRSYALAQSIGDSIIQSYALGNMASMYMEIDEIEKALDYQQRGLAIETAFKDNIAMIDSHSVLAGCYASMGKSAEAKKHYQSALDLASNLSAKTKLITVYAEGFAMYEKLGEYKNAFLTSVKYHQLYDSLLNGERTQQIADMREKYETAQKEIAIEKLEEDQRIADLELEQKRSENFMLVGAAILLLIILLSITFFFYQVQKQKKAVESRNVTISKINTDLEVSRNELLASNQTKDKFFALVAHDLRGPVTSLQGMGQMLEYYMKKGDKDRLSMLTSQLDQSTNSVSHLLDNLLKWAISQTQGISFNPERFELNPLLNEILEVFNESLRAKEITVESEIAESVYVNADYNMISTVIRNLLSNAIKFSPPGSAIEIIGCKNESIVDIKIKDHGMGIPQHTIDELLQENLVSSTSGTMGEKGTGLGLSLCRQFIGLHEQEFLIQNTGSGTQIMFTLNLAS